tara:strand:+ start:240 stop:512 length:273 start_codon:yes stop_codon:yes gene_type:complete
MEQLGELVESTRQPVAIIPTDSHFSTIFEPKDRKAQRWIDVQFPDRETVAKRSLVPIGNQLKGPSQQRMLLLNLITKVSQLAATTTALRQ